MSELLVDKVRAAADSQRADAKRIMCRLLGMPEGVSSEAVDNLVDCIIGAAMLETTMAMRTAFTSEVKS